MWSGKNIQRSRTIVAGAIVMTLFQCGARGDTGSTAVRKPAVAGQFYSANPSKLRQEVEGYLAAGKKLGEYPRIIISPHAGYVFSGPVAGIGFATIDPGVKKVILVGPSHHKYFDGVSIPEAEAYETPLGQVKLAFADIKKLRSNPLVHAYPDAHSREHCLEVQLPFLQVILKEFTIIPVITGNVEPAVVADLLFPLIDKSTLVVISSDFSHYHSNNEARQIDKASIETIVNAREEGPIDACGELPIRVAMHLAKKMGLTPRLLDARNSFETCPEYGSGDRVVGYASIVYMKNGGEAGAVGASVEKTGGMGAPDKSMISDSDKTFLLKLAREALERAVKSEKPPSPADIPAACREMCGCFVTLTKAGELRGCIGYLEGIKPLWQAVIDNAKNAALNDPRFPAVAPQELQDIKVEVSVLTKPEPFEYKDPADLLSKLESGRDGLILSVGYRQSTFLPQVWDQLPDKVEFLEHLSRKAGLPKDAWKEASYKRYFAIHFEERK